MATVESETVFSSIGIAGNDAGTGISIAVALISLKAVHRLQGNYTYECIQKFYVQYSALLPWCVRKIWDTISKLWQSLIPLLLHWAFALYTLFLHWSHSTWHTVSIDRWRLQFVFLNIAWAPWVAPYSLVVWRAIVSITAVASISLQLFHFSKQHYHWLARRCGFAVGFTDAAVDASMLCYMLINFRKDT